MQESFKVRVPPAKGRSGTLCDYGVCDGAGCRNRASAFHSELRCHSSWKLQEPDQEAGGSSTTQSWLVFYGDWTSKVLLSWSEEVDQNRPACAGGKAEGQREASHELLQLL